MKYIAILVVLGVVIAWLAIVMAIIDAIWGDYTDWHDPRL